MTVGTIARASDSTVRRWKLPSFENTSFMLVFLGLPLAIYVIFVISPFVQAFYYSMTDWKGFSPKMNFVGLANYFALLQDPVFTKAVLNSIVLVVVLPPLVIVLSMTLATLVTVRSLVIAALAVAVTAATVAFRPTRIEEATIVGEIRSEIDDVRVRVRSIRAEEAHVRRFAEADHDAIRRQAIEALVSHQPIGCQMRTDPAAFAGLLGR